MITLALLLILASSIVPLWGWYAIGEEKSLVILLIWEAVVFIGLFWVIFHFK